MPIMSIWGTMPVIIIFCLSVTRACVCNRRCRASLDLLVHHLAGVAHGCDARGQILDLIRRELAVFLVAEIILQAAKKKR